MAAVCWESRSAAVPAGAQKTSRKCPEHFRRRLRHQHEKLGPALPVSGTPGCGVSAVEEQSRQHRWKVVSWLPWLHSPRLEGMAARLQQFLLHFEVRSCGPWRSCHLEMEWTRSGQMLARHWSCC